MTTLNFDPFGYNVVLEMPVFEEKTEGGVIKSSKMIEEEVKAVNKYLEVFAVGSQVKEISIGDRVLLNNGNHQIINVDGTDYFLVNQGLILGKTV